MIDRRTSIQGLAAALAALAGTGSVTAKPNPDLGLETARLALGYLDNMHYDLRDRLTSLLGFSDILASQPDISHEKRIQYARDIHQVALGLLAEIESTIENVNGLRQ
jgi:hypothetical protein